MSPPDAPNPERRSDNALLCFCIGAGLLILSYFLGIGGVLAAALSGGQPAMLAGGIAAIVLVSLTAVSGIILALIGGIWMIARVIADQRGEPSEKRYRDVER